MTQTPELVELKARLLAVEGGTGRGDTNWYRNPDGPEAAQAIERLEAEVAGLMTVEPWWRDVIGDKYQPSEKLATGVKYLHPQTVKPIFEAHKGTEVADVIAGLIFKMMISFNREQFLVKCANEQRDAAEARATTAEASLALAREALGQAREEILGFVNARWSEAEGSDADYVGYIDATLQMIDRGGADV